jgi:hypothetical protein
MSDPPQLLDPDALVAAATAAAGHDDFGGEEFREGLGVYCDSLRSEAQLSEIGTYALQGNLVASLTNRLRITDWRRRHPDAASAPIAAPLFVIGLFRAGTTLMSQLLDLDPGNRSLLGWEAADSVPPPTPGTYREGERVQAARDRAAMLDQLNPELKAIHHEEPDGPTECITLLAQDFKALLWESIANVPTYGRWLFATDHRSAYVYHRGCLEVLQSQGVTGRWCLKSPHHAIALDALAAVYPDARLVYLHRDPVAVVASACSLIGCLSGTFSAADHRAYIAQRWSDVLVESVDRVDAFRAGRPDYPILDLQYADLLADPVATVAEVYRFAGLPFGGTVETVVAEYVRTHPRGRFGTHRYTAAEAGLDQPQLRERFAPYMARYGVALET